MAHSYAVSNIDVYSASEIAQAAGVPESQVLALVSSGQLQAVGNGKLPYFSAVQSVAAVRTLRSESGRRSALMFEPPRYEHASPRLPIAVSSAVHAAIGAAIVLMSAIGFAEETTSARVEDPVTTRLVFIATPGPGGGGGGGGLRQKAPPPRAQRQGKASLDSPMPVRKAPEPIETPPAPEPPPPPPPVEPEPLPPVVAPVATVAANEAAQPGVVDEPAPPVSDSRGPGVGGGVGSGAGTGLGQGQGSGIGEGSGGGMGGGPYRPGSGIAPPRLLREVKAGYTEEARRANVEGEVLLELVVRRDGSVSDIRILRGLPAGLNDRAIAAVRQWRFSPATRLGQAVDVLVEVAVEFKLR